MSALTKILGNFLFSLSLIIGFCNFCFAQKNVDLDVKSESSSEIARGGETLSYTITVSNIGLAKATNVILTTEPDNLIKITSNAASKGKCEEYISGNYARKSLRCHLEDVDVGEIITIVVDVKVVDFGDISDNTIRDAPTISPFFKLPSSAINSEPVKERNPISTTYINAKESEENTENNRAKAFAELLPSKNIPPRVQIISPKNETVITRSTKKLSKVTFTIKAFDPDGTIEKVFVNTQQFEISVEHPENRIIIEGKSYSSKEVEENKDLQKYWGGEATKVSKDTYTFTLKNPKYGLTQMFVDATDNGGRSATAHVRLTVRGDNSIEFTRPLKDSVVKPNTDLIIETKSTLNDGGNGKFQLIGNAICCGTSPQMKEISRNGNTFIHQYFWKNISRGNYYLQIALFEDSGAFSYSEALQFIVTEKPLVKITSLKNGQIFNSGEEIPIEIDTSDSDGQVKDVVIYTNGTYQEDFSWKEEGWLKRGKIRWLRKGVYTIIAKAKDDFEVESESEPITIIVK
jgi:uncharacterized repeat protein (TIGR01451 family)